MFFLSGGGRTAAITALALTGANLFAADSLSTPAGNDRPLRIGARIATITLVASGESVSSSDETAALTRLNTELRRFTSYRILPLTESRSRLADADFARADDCVDEQCLIEAGRILSVDYTVAAWLGTTDTMPVLTAIMVDVQAKRTVRFVRRDARRGMAMIAQVLPGIAEALNWGASPPAAPDSGAATGGALTVTFVSEPPGAQITVDDSIHGVAPLVRDSLQPGTHRVSAVLDGYRPFRKTVTIPPGGAKRVRVKLSRIITRLNVVSQPSGATVYLSDSSAGTTPYASSTLRPGVYQLRVEKADYVPFRREVTVLAREPTNVSCVLLTKAFADSVRRAHQRAFRTGRRIVFGAGATIFGLAGLLYNGKVADDVKAEDQAFDAYNTDGLSQSEYDRSWAAYLSKRRATADDMRGRNALYVLGAICGVGFTLSIPF